MSQTVKNMPLMVTGGFRSRVVMEKAIQSGACQLVGIGRPVCGSPDSVKKLLKREINELPKYEEVIDLPWFLRPLRYIVIGQVIKAGGFQLWTFRNLIRMGDGEEPTTEKNANILRDLIEMGFIESARARSLKGLDGIVGEFVNAPPFYTRTIFKLLLLVLAVFVGWLSIRG